MEKIRTILVPTDFSELSDKAIAYAADIARQEGAKLVILHVIEVIQQCFDVYCLDQKLIADLEKKSTAQSRKMMDQEVLRVDKLRKLDYRTELKTGTPHDEILQELKKKKIDLVVMGAHKKKGFIDRFLGSVADRVTRGAKCPVLLIKS